MYLAKMLPYFHIHVSISLDLLACTRVFHIQAINGLPKSEIGPLLPQVHLSHANKCNLNDFVS